MLKRERSKVILTYTSLKLCTKYADSKFHDDRERCVDVIVSETIKQTHRRKAKRSSKNETYRFARLTNRNTFWGENGILNIGRPLIFKFIAIVKKTIYSSLYPYSLHLGPSTLFIDVIRLG